jgi:hypothetical protein
MPSCTRGNGEGVYASDAVQRQAVQDALEFFDKYLRSRVERQTLH